jgi:hypothetical protein
MTTVTIIIIVIRGNNVVVVVRSHYDHYYYYYCNCFFINHDLVFIVVYIGSSPVAKLDSRTRLGARKTARPYVINLGGSYD